MGHNPEHVINSNIMQATLLNEAFLGFLGNGTPIGLLDPNEAMTA